MDDIQNQFANIFTERLKDYKNVRNNNKITRVEYLVLFIHFVVGIEFITPEQKLKDNKEFIVLQEWDANYICKHLANAINETSLCEQEYVFLYKMIDIIKSANFLDDYIKAYDETKVFDCTLAPLFQKLFSRSKELEIIED